MRFPRNPRLSCPDRPRQDKMYQASCWVLLEAFFQRPYLPPGIYVRSGNHNLYSEFLGSFIKECPRQRKVSIESERCNEYQDLSHAPPSTFGRRGEDLLS